MAHKHTKELSYLLEQLVLVYGHDELVAVAGTNSQVSQLNSGGRTGGEGVDVRWYVATRDEVREEKNIVKYYKKSLSKK